MKNLLALSDEILLYLLEYKGSNLDFTFSLRQRDSVQASNVKRLENGQWFQGSHYIYVPLFKRGDNARKVKTIGFVINFDENHTTSNYIEISFKGGAFSEEEKTFHRLMSEYVSLQLNEDNHGIYHFPNQEDIFSNLKFYITEFRDKAIQILKEMKIEDNFIISELEFQKNLLKINNIRQQRYPSIMNTLNTKLDLLRYKKQIILQGPPGTGKTRLAKELSKDILGIQTDEELLESDNFEIVQFHPSYSYEDFVEGMKPIVTKEKSIRYETVSGSFKRFCEKALLSCFDSSIQSSEQDFNTIYNEYVDYLKTLPDTFYFKTKNNYDIAFAGVKESGIIVKYRYANSKTKEPGNHYFTIPKSKIQKVLNEGIKPSDIKSLKGDLFPIVQHIAGELFAVYRHFYEFIQDKGVDIEYVDASVFDYQRCVEEYNLAKAENRLKLDTKFIFIIDEINRANLSSVLGELIYALEYRGDGVKSVYSSEDGNEFIIPPNLYIIGTMNTADRSVGHIDYAIRRRFAFVDVLPKDLSDDDTIIFHKGLFEKVSRFFIENYDEYLKDEKIPLKAAATLSSEFRPEDVWLGHSYFIQKKEEGTGVLIPNDFNIRLEYEIKPILLEYVKDGILVGEDIIQKIKDLKATS